MTSKWNPKSFFNRPGEQHIEDIREGGQESYQGEFASMDPYMQRDSIAAMSNERRSSSASEGSTQQQGEGGGPNTGFRRLSKHFKMTEVPEELNTV